MMLALLIYAYATGRFGSRTIEAATHSDVAVRYLCANHHPDHASICAFRTANKTAFEDLKEHQRRVLAEKRRIQKSIEEFSTDVISKGSDVAASESTGALAERGIISVEVTPSGIPSCIQKIDWVRGILHEQVKFLAGSERTLAVASRLHSLAFQLSREGGDELVQRATVVVQVEYLRGPGARLDDRINYDCYRRAETGH